MDRGAVRKTAVVLSGGGARGAYEAGVLSYIFEELPQVLGHPVHFDIVTGTSVGAIHATFLAAHGDQGDATARLREVWFSLAVENVFGPRGLTDVVRLPFRLLGLGGPPAPLPATGKGITERLPGLFDTAWLEDIVLHNIDWARLRHRLDQGEVDALAIAATEIATGRSVVFVDRGGREQPPWARDPFVIARATRIGPAHAMASAAIPLIFPALRIDRTYYCDGGLRLNTPLAPALRLGADRVLVISLRYPRPADEEDRIARRREASYNSLSYLAGKALNALLLDRIEYDVERMRLFNTILQTGRERYGEDFLHHINEAIARERGVAYRIVEDCLLQPSRDLGELAAECLQHRRPSRTLRDWVSQSLVRFTARGTIGEADLLSYIYFDRCYAAHLFELGRKDAARAQADLVRFFS